MSQLTYAPRNDGTVAVRLENRLVGLIRQDKDGFRYYPKGQTGGDAFATLGMCQRSLLIEDGPEPPAEETSEAYHVRLLKLTWRDEKNPKTFDQELQEYLNAEAAEGYGLEQLKELTRSRNEGFVDDVVVLVITRVQ